MIFKEKKETDREGDQDKFYIKKIMAKSIYIFVANFHERARTKNI